MLISRRLIICIAALFVFALSPYSVIVLQAKQPAEKAAAETLKLAEQGDREAQFRMNIMYAKGYGVPKNLSESAKWLRMSAEGGLAIAQHVLGDNYVAGINGFPQSYKEAFKWLQLAAVQNDPDAQTSLGWLYMYGRGVEQDFVTAAKWLQLAADQNVGPAQSSLGVLYAVGKGVERDIVKAYTLFKLAGPYVIGAKESIRVISESMTAEQIKAGERLAEHWKSTHSW